MESYNNGLYVIISTTFSGFKAITEGSIFYVDGLRLGLSSFINILIQNCSSSVSLIYFGSSANNLLKSINFQNVEGRIFKITQRSSISIQFLTITNISCNNEAYFQSGAIFYVDSLSSISITQVNITNLKNTASPGAFYLENSKLIMNDFNVTNVKSSSGIACMSAFGSIANITKSYFNDFLSGCFYIEKSTVFITNCKFLNKGTKVSNNIYASVVECFLCIKLVIDEAVFYGNINNSEDGGVIFLMKNIFYIIFILFY